MHRLARPLALFFTFAFAFFGGDGFDRGLSPQEAKRLFADRWLECQSVHASKNKVDKCKLFGKIKFVDNFPDVKIQIVEHFPDLKVKKVKNFADKPGLWRIVENFPDFKVQIVDNFPDYKVKYVDNFPGCD